MTAIEQLEKLPCKTCKGTRTVTLDATRTWPCPDCQETGLAFPCLTRPCPGPQGFDEPDCWCANGYNFLPHDTPPYYRKRLCPTCKGTGRVPKTPPEQLQVLLGEATQKGEVSFRNIGKFNRCYLRSVDFIDWQGAGDTPLDALATAVLKSQEAKHD